MTLLLTGLIFCSYQNLSKNILQTA